MKPDFEEKQYENAANGELRLNTRFMYSAGQVAEGLLLGFDVAAHLPANSPIWRLFAVSSPSGLLLNPSLWPFIWFDWDSIRLPSFIVSLILQYKRSDYLTTANASQYDYWHREYYRFEIVEHQQDQLLALEDAANGRAIVRYAAPTFHEYTMLERHMVNEAILDNSNFVSPSSLGVQHSVWTFTRPGVAGYANPEGEEIRAESWTQVLERLSEGSEETTVLKHLRAIASSLNDLTEDSFLERKEVINYRDLMPKGDPDFVQGLLDFLRAGFTTGILNW